MSHITITKIQQRERPFVMVDKHPLFDPRYSWAEKGILATLLALKDSGSVKLTEMHHFSSDGERATKTAQKGLKSLGHLKVINEGGRWYAEVYEQPLSEPVLTYEKRQKPPNKLADVLKSNGLTDEQITAIVKQMETDEAPETIKETPKKELQIVKLEVKNTTPSVSKEKTVFTSDEREELTTKYVAEMKEDTAFLETLTKDYNITTAEGLSEKLNEFLNRPATLGLPNITNYVAFARHFYNWIPKAAKAKQQAKNVKNGSKLKGLPTHEEIKVELKRSVDMVINNSKKEGFNYMKEAVNTVSHWMEKGEKLKLVIDAETLKKASYIWQRSGNEDDLKALYEYLCSKN